ncbi:PEGA domain-containing protein [Deinococcus sonorensis]|uniref:PEGA domain-containing protein n=2 Tax=Deinococcus sonorensis TaxID=309891 RepID=A0AAU7U8M1_9DEIO
MRRSAVPLLLASLGLTACAPAALRGQPGARLQLSTTFPVPEVRPGYFRRPGPVAVQATSNADAYVYGLLLPEHGATQLLAPADGPFTRAGVQRQLALPPLSGFTQLFTVASQQPLDLQGAVGTTSVSALGAAVAAATRTLPAGSWNVATDVFRVSDFGTLSVTGSPLDARVTVNGEVLGRTPLTDVPVPAGSVTVRVERDGYVTFTQTVTINPDQRLTLTPALRPVPLRLGRLVVESSVPASVALDEVPLGVTPLLVQVKAGNHTLLISPLDGQPGQRLPVSLRSGATLTVGCDAASGSFTCTLR